MVSRPHQYLQELVESCPPAVIQLWLDGLNERTRFVVETRMGMNGRPVETLEAIGPKLEGVGSYKVKTRSFGTALVSGQGVTRERVRQMEAKALRLLRKEVSKWNIVQANP